MNGFRLPDGVISMAFTWPDLNIPKYLLNEATEVSISMESAQSINSKLSGIREFNAATFNGALPQPEGRGATKNKVAIDE